MTFQTLWRAPSGSGSPAMTAIMPGSATPGEVGATAPVAATAAAEAKVAAVGGYSDGQPAERKPIAFHFPRSRGSSQPAGSGGVFVGAPPPGIELAIYHPPHGVVITTTAGQPIVYSSGSAGAAGLSTGTAWGKVLPEGEGEVVTRGPHVMLGYWEDEAATQAAFLPGGWMRTGDLGHIHKGEAAAQFSVHTFVRSI